MSKAKIATFKEIEMNRWCIEMAMKWPTITEYSGNAGVYSAGGGLGQQQRDADVIGRAEKIAAWIKIAR